MSDEGDKTSETIDTEVINAQPTKKSRNFLVTVTNNDNLDLLNLLLFDAVKIGDVDNLRTLLTKGADPTVQSHDLSTPLIIASRQGFYDCILLILEHTGVIIDQKGEMGRTALMYAVQGHLNCARLLLERGANPNATTDMGGTSLMVSSLCGHLSCVLLLLEQPGIKIDQQNAYGVNALMSAAQRGHTECLIALAAKRAALSLRNSNGQTALILACEQAHISCLKFLLDHPGVDVNEMDNFRRTPLQIAVIGGNTQCVQFLMERGANPSIANDVGDTPLLLACDGGKVECVSLLLQHSNVDINHKNNEGSTALIKSSQKGHLGCVQTLVRYYIDTNLKFSSEISEFAAACREVCVEASSILDDSKKLLIDDRDLNARTALMHAVHYGHVECVRLLLSKGCDITLRSQYGATPLFIASRQGRHECLSLLLKHPNVEIDDQQRFNGCSPIYFAIQESHIECLRVLINHGANINLRSNDGFSPLAFAANRGFVAGLSFLLEQPGVQINQTDNNGRTALHTSALNGNVDCVRVLLDKGADCTLRSNFGYTALYEATHQGHFKVVSLLVEHERISHDFITDQMGAAALLEAAGVGYHNCLNVLLEAGIDANVRNDVGDNALMVASRVGHADCVASLLRRRELNVDEKNPRTGRNALMVACYAGHANCVVELLRNQVDVNLTDQDGTSALLLASSRGHIEIVLLLVEQGGIDLNQRDRNGHTSLMAAAQNGRIDCQRILLQQGADASLRSRDGITCLMFASHRNHAASISLLLDQPGVDVDQVDNLGHTALMTAVQGGQSESVRILLDKGADVKLKDFVGMTAIDHAATSEMKKILIASLEPTTAYVLK